MDLKIVDSETAKLLKDILFNEIVDHFYEYGKIGRMPNRNSEFPSKESFQSAPTQEFARKFLRDIHCIHIIIELKKSEPTMQGFFWRGYFARLIALDPKNSYRMIINKELPSGEKWSYEQALEEGIKKTCKYLLSQKDN